MKNKDLKIKKNNIVYKVPLGPRNYMICVRTRKEIVKKAREYGINISESLHNFLEETVYELDKKNSSAA